MNGIFFFEPNKTPRIYASRPECTLKHYNKVYYVSLCIHRYTLLFIKVKGLGLDFQPGRFFTQLEKMSIRMISLLISI